MWALPRGLVVYGLFAGDSNGYGEPAPPEGVRSDEGGDETPGTSFKTRSCGTPRFERFAERGVGGPRRPDRSEALEMFDEERCRDAIVIST